MKQNETYIEKPIYYTVNRVFVINKVADDQSVSGYFVNYDDSSKMIHGQKFTAEYFKKHFELSPIQIR